MLTRLLTTCLILAFAFPAYASMGKPVPDYEAIRVASGVWVIHGPMEFPTPENQGFMNNPAWVETSAGIVVVDPGSSVQVGEMLMRVMRKHSQAPVVAIFNTHKHGDHWLGNQAVRAAYPDVPIYAQTTVLKAIAEGEGAQWVSSMSSLTKGATDGTRVVSADHPLMDGNEITIGDVLFRMHHKDIAHSEGDLMIEMPASGVLFMGDSAVNGRVVRLDDGSTKGNIAALNFAMGLNPKVVVPGHGPTGGAEILREYAAYLGGIYDTVARLYEDGLSDFEMKDEVIKASSRFKDWAGFDEELGRNLNRTFLEIEADDF